MARATSPAESAGWKAFRVIFVERRLPGRLVGAFYRTLRRFGVQKVTLKTPQGLTVSCFTDSAPIFVEVFRKEDYDVPSLAWAGRKVIDIGANQGFFSLYAAHKGAEVIAYEPADENLESLHSNIGRNWLAERITVRQAAVTGGAREVDFFVGVDETGGILSGSASIMNDNRGGVSAHKRRVTGIPINEVFDDLGPDERCALLKIDCEGAEYEIFEQIEVSNLERVDHIAIEFHERGADVLIDKLKAAGFEVTSFEGDRSGLVKASRG